MADPELHPHTVLRGLSLPHCSEGEHEAFEHDVPDDPSSPLHSVGMVPCEHRPGRYEPGLTVHLTDEQADELVGRGVVAPAGATVVAGPLSVGTSAAAAPSEAVDPEGD